ncbi:hypothetical protein EYB53_021150 [Candidatus Chloroploca sp. M-50]|uniref:Uncharacterized protein n=1 Tax=Candidatus Chloroploca mongolica TaxID=2528176 RepID=A0ABS4DFJ9_9CHLR|nr:hypothetical protein [Candidatus Chloroploca mongolica]MBP1468232.1 hypothetical protein [Candidatus Chloroploca mongolica]
MTSTLRLSIEELALAFSLTGQDQVAHAFLVSSFGTELSQAEVRGKLSAASHTLLGQQLIALDDVGNLLVSPVLDEVATVLTATQRTIRFSLSIPEGQRLLSYHATTNGFYEHWVDQGVTHVITLVTPAALFEAAPIFFNLDAYPQMPDLSGKITNTLLRQALRCTDVATAKRLLQTAELPDNVLDALSATVVATVAVGDVLDVRPSPSGTPEANQGLLLLFGQEHYWIFQPQPQADDLMLTLLPSTTPVLHTALEQLLASA